MKHSFLFLFASALACASIVSSAQATDTAESAHFAQETPLMVIRFNQAQVDYPMPLYNTISSALQAKPSAVFDIVSVAPYAKTTHNQPYYNQVAEQDTHKVLQTLHEMGLPAQRVSMVSAVDNVSAPEVRIYVH